jgi:RNA polymerase sigma-70 factor (ECF subfamily)
MLGGSAGAFEALYDRRQGGVYRYALRMTGSEAIAEDVTQDVFIELMRDGRLYDPSRGSLKSYLYEMARHRVFSSTATSWTPRWSKPSSRLPNTA